jgi:hypothetical protein
MTTAQLLIDKATAFFVNLQTRYGVGPIYTSKVVKKFSHKFTFSNIRIGEGGEFSVGILHEPSLTTLIFCKQVNAFKDSGEGFPVTYELYAGKLGPLSERHIYPNVMRLMHNRGKENAITALTISEIVGYLGQVAKDVTLPEYIHKEHVLEIFFDTDAKITGIKKGL